MKLGAFSISLAVKDLAASRAFYEKLGFAVGAFDDARAIQRVLIERGLELQAKADESTTGPASLVLADPDGNPILLDQHVPSPMSE